MWTLGGSPTETQQPLTSEDSFTAQDRFVPQDKLVVWEMESVPKTENVFQSMVRESCCAVQGSQFLLTFSTQFCPFLPRCLQGGGVCSVRHRRCWSQDEASACTAKCCTLGFSQRLKCSVEDIWGPAAGGFCT